ncbi:ribosome silencing factor [Ruminococcaceae bacterium OttesenSCG-928-O06]|nr:ribosome silencing factor [Ruminococcaceae bacterium OttesenSCG-928-O06]
MQPLELAKTIATILDNKKAKDIQVLKVRDLTVLADYFVIASGTSTTQVGALYDEVDFQMGQKGVQPLRVEGAATRNWVLLDYGAVVVHVFYPEAREFYALEHMWADAEKVDMAFLEEQTG